MATVTLYRLQHLQVNKNKTIDFSSVTERDAFFSFVTNKLELSSDFVGWIKNIYELDNEITITSSLFSTLYNYVEIRNGSSMKYYYFIVSQEELGNSQWSLKLRLDTLMTYVTTPNMGIYLSNGRQLVLKEHKPRFDFSESKPIYDQFIEPYQVQHHETTKSETLNIDQSDIIHTIEIDFSSGGSVEGKLAVTGNLWIDDKFFLIPFPFYMYVNSSTHTWHYAAPIINSSFDTEIDGTEIVKVKDGAGVIIYSWSKGNTINDEATLPNLSNVNFSPFPPFYTAEPKYQGRVRLAYANLDAADDYKPVAFVFTEEPKNMKFTKAALSKTIAPGWVIANDYTITFNGQSYDKTEDWSKYFHRVRVDAFGQWFVVRVLKSNGIIITDTQYTIPEAPDIKWEVSENVQAFIYSGLGNTEIRTWDYIVKNKTNEVPSYFYYKTKTFKDIDYSDARFKKIVEYPYFDFSADFKLKDEGGGDYNIYIDFDQVNSVGFKKQNLIPAFDMSKTDKARVSLNDPKIYHSQFIQHAINIYGNNLVIKPENMPSRDLEFTLDIDIASSNSIRLKYKTIRNNNNLDDEEVFAINNQVTQIISEGYTYQQYYKDIEQRQLQIQENSINRNTAISTINQVLGVVGGLTAGFEKINPVQLGMRSGQALMNIASSIADAEDQKKNNSLNYAQKIQSMKLSEINIIGSGLKFMNIDDKDKIHIITRKPIEKELKFIDDMLYFEGYSCLEYKTPTFKTRKYFDFKRMALDEVEVTAAINEDIKNDIKRRFLEGVTIFHPQADLSIDWYQTKENWEI